MLRDKKYRSTVDEHSAYETDRQNLRGEPFTEKPALSSSLDDTTFPPVLAPALGFLSQALDALVHSRASTQLL